MKPSPWLLLPALLLAACAPTAYTPAPVRPRDAETAIAVNVTIIARATDDTAATVTARAAKVFERDSESTAVANAVTALALTPTAAAMALTMVANADRATQTAVWAPTRAAETQAIETVRAQWTQAAATRTATVQAGLAQAAEYDARVKRAQSQADLQRWQNVTVFVTNSVCVLIAGLVAVALIWLGGMAAQKVLRAYYQAQQEKAKALVELVRRNGDLITAIDLRTGKLEIRQGPRQVEPPRPSRELAQIAHVPIINDDQSHDLDMSGRRGLRETALELLDAALEYQADNPEWPNGKIPSSHKLGWGGDRWTTARDALGECVSGAAGNGKDSGTWVAGRFADVADLRQRIASGTIVL